MIFFQKLLENFITDENFKNSEALVAFLFFVDRSQFEQKMKELTSINIQIMLKMLEFYLWVYLLLIMNKMKNIMLMNYYKIKNQLFDRLNYYYEKLL